MGTVNYNKGASGNNAILLRNVDPNLVYPVGLVTGDEGRVDGTPLSDEEVAFFPLETAEFGDEGFKKHKSYFLYDYEDYDIQKLEAQKNAGKLYMTTWDTLPTSAIIDNFIVRPIYKGKTYFYFQDVG